MKVEMWPIENVIPYARNPRKNDQAVAAVKASIKEFGFQQPLVVNSEGVIVVGHTRLKAAQELGLTNVPVTIAKDLSESQIKAYRILDNKTGEKAEWDSELLGLELDDLAEFDFGEFDCEFEKGDGEVNTQEDEIPEVSEDEPASKLGDVWLCGKHKVYCGDSRAGISILCPATKYDMLLTDPPYGVSYVGKTADALTVENDELSEGDLSLLMLEVFDEVQKQSRGGAYWYATVPAGPLHLVFAHDWKQRGVLRQIMVWAKDSMVLGHSEYHYQHEPILFGWTEGDRHKNSDRTRTTLWEVSRPKASREHPTMKPIELWAMAIKDGSRKGETVLDPFLGSGTTLIACERLNRICYGCEISPKYVDVICKRYHAETGIVPTLETTGEPFPIP